MTTGKQPRRLTKEVQQVADHLRDNGWRYLDEDHKGHPIYLWPGTGDTITLPTTPRSDLWKRLTLTQANKIMGLAVGKRNPTAARQRQRERTRRARNETAAADRRHQAEQSRKQAATDLITARANAQLEDTARDLRCTPAQAARRLAELNSYARLMGARSF